MTNPIDGRITSLATFPGSLSTSDLFMVVSPGNAASGINYKVPFGFLSTSIASAILPPNGLTGTIFVGQGLATAPSFVPVSGDIFVTNSSSIATTTITTHAVTFAKMQQVAGLSVPGIAGTATADMAAITGTQNQVLRVDANGSTLGFGAINIATGAAVTGVMGIPNGGTGTSALTSLGLVYGNGTSALNVIPAGTTAWPLVGNGSAVLPSFQVLTVPGGGTGTTTLALNRVLIGNGTSTIASTNVATTGFPLVGNGTSAVPGFAILGVPGGGIGTGTLTTWTVLIGGSTATSQVQSIATTGASGLVLTSQGSAALPIFAAAGAGTLTQVNTSGLITGGPITVNGTVTVTAATAADMTTGTSTTLAVVPAVVRFGPGAAKFWVNFRGVDGLVFESYNVSTVSRVSTGTFSIVLTTAFASATSFVCFANSASAGGGVGLGFFDSAVSTAGSIRVVFQNSVFAATDPTFAYVDGFGRQ